MRGLRIPIWIDIKSLIIVGRTFVEFIDHARVIKDMNHEGRDKRPKY